MGHNVTTRRRERRAARGRSRVTAATARRPATGPTTRDTSESQADRIPTDGVPTPVSGFEHDPALARSIEASRHILRTAVLWFKHTRTQHPELRQCDMLRSVSENGGGIFRCKYIAFMNASAGDRRLIYSSGRGLVRRGCCRILIRVHFRTLCRYFSVL